MDKLKTYIATLSETILGTRWDGQNSALDKFVQETAVRALFLSVDAEDKGWLFCDMA
jgi:hypothetical protein